MTTAPSPPKAPPRPPPPAPPKAPPPAKSAASTAFGVSRGARQQAQRIVAYGPGGIGKSSLTALLPNVKIIDIEDGSNELDVARVELPAGRAWTWELLREAVNTPAVWAGVDNLVIDTGTRAEELAVAWTIANVKHEKGHAVADIEGYGFGKGFSHVYDTFLPLLGDLDAHVRAGRNVVLICHDCTTSVPNPTGEDWLRYEPRLQSPASGKNSIRHRVREWCDHMLFIGYDLFVNKEGKATGSGTRTIYPVEMPHCMAKSRRLSAAVPYTMGDSAIWTALFTAKETSDAAH